MAYVDKRDHHRIEDNIQVAWKSVHKSAIKDGNALDYFESGNSFNVLRELYQLELDAGDLLRVINENNRQLGSFLHNLNRRIALLARATIIGEGTGNSPEAEPLRISEGGMSFVTSELLGTGTTLALKLLFDSTSLCIACFGEVRHSRLLEAREDYLVGVRFLDIDSTSRTLLQRHILHRQAEERRERLRRDAGI